MATLPDAKDLEYANALAATEARGEEFVDADVVPKGDEPARKQGRPKTINGKLPMFRGDDLESYPRNAQRPKTRGDCCPSDEGGNHARPCPYVSCKFHLLLDVTRSGSLKVNWPAESLDGIVENLATMKETCALDVADRGEMTLEDIGGLLNVTRERIRQMAEKLLLKMRRSQSVGRVLGEPHEVDGKMVDSDDYSDEYEPDEDDDLAGLFPTLRTGAPEAVEVPAGIFDGDD